VPHGEVSELVHVSVPAETSALRNESTDWRYIRSAICSARSKDRRLVPVRGIQACVHRRDRTLRSDCM